MLLLLITRVNGPQVQKDGVWVERELFLMKKEVGFSHLGGKDMQDYIELREIDKVIASDGGGGRLLDNVKKEERFSERSHCFLYKLTFVQTCFLSTSSSVCAVSLPASPALCSHAAFK